MIFLFLHNGDGGYEMPPFPNLISFLFFIIGAILVLITFVILPPQFYTLIIGYIFIVIGGILW